MIIIVDPDAGARARIEKRLPQEETVHVPALAELQAALANREADVVFLGPGIVVRDAIALVQQLGLDRPEIGFVLIADAVEIATMQAALRAGVRDILTASFSPVEALGVIERIRAMSRQLRERAQHEDPHGERAPNADHQVITVFSSKGGVGKSFVSVNLAMLLARRTSEPVVLVDLDLQFGDLAIMLQLFPARTIHEASQMTDNLDADALEGYLAEHRTGVKLLAAPFEPGLAETVAPGAVTQILRLLRQTYRYIVVDTPAAFNEHVMAALDDSDRCVLLGSMDVPSIKNMKLALQTLSLLDVPRDRINLVLNRADSEVGLRVQEVERTLGTTVDIAIPSGREVPLSINRGVPLVSEAPSSPVAAALGKLAALVAGPGEPVLAAPGKSKRWMKRSVR